MPVPLSQDRVDRARRLSAVHSAVTVARIIGINRNTIAKMRKRGWKAATSTCPPRPMPPDFAIQVRHMGYDELQEHYSASTTTIAKWKRTLGLPMIERRR